MRTGDLEGTLVAPVRYVVYLIALTAWAVVGFVFWIPVLVRATAVFSSMILYSTLTGVRSKYLGRHLDAAIIFYVSGFRRIGEAMFAAVFEAESDSDELPPFKISQFFMEAVWATAFWLSIYIWVSDETFGTFFLAALQRLLVTQ